MTYDGQEYTLTTFDANFAASGGVLFASYLDGTDTKYEMATEFTVVQNNKEFPYRAKITEKFYNFSPSGQTSQGKYTLWCASAVIDSAGATEGDIYPDTKGGQTVHISMTDLDYRETVALQTLNAMVKHIGDPLAYSPATIKALISKAFTFSIEFVNQARKYRTENTHDEGGTPVADIDDNAVTALVAMTQKLEDIRAQTVNIKNALDGTTATGVSARVNTAATAINTVATNVSTVGTNLSTVGTKITPIATNVNKLGNKLDSNTTSLIEAIRDKVVIPESSLVVAGTVDTNTMRFTPNSATVTINDAISQFQQGKVVLLKYPLADNTDRYDMVVYAKADANAPFVKTQASYFWATSSIQQTVTGTLDANHVFTPAYGEMAFSTALNYFLEGIPVYLYNQAMRDAIISYNPTLGCFRTTNGWTWTED